MVDARNSGFRDNGTSWIRFGDGIFSGCRRIDLSESDMETGSHVVTCSEKNSQFDRLKVWVKENFSKRLNLSPKSPEYLAVQPVKWLRLYSSVDGGTDNSLLWIPLYPEVLNTGDSVEEPAYKKKVAEIKSFFESK